jgi:trk system potassium uptake protein
MIFMFVARNALYILRNEMKIVLVGAGDIGAYLCSVLSGKGYDVTVVDASDDKVHAIDEQYNVRAFTGNGASARVLVEAGVRDCDQFMAMTSDDNTNLIASSLAKSLGARCTITRIHDQTFSDNTLINYQVQFGIDHMLHPERLCAVELAKTIRNSGRVAVENFARGLVEVQQVRLEEGSRMAGRTVADTRIAPRARIVFVQREGLNEVPTANTVLKAGDMVTLFGSPDSLFEIRSQFESLRDERTVKVVLYGGSEIAISMIRLMMHPRFRIRVVEKDPQLCHSLADSFEKITVINGDAKSMRFLEEEQIGSADYFVACTKDDESNIVTCLQARKLGVPHVQAVINKGDYEPVIDGLRASIGIAQIVSPRLAMANEVMRCISPDACIDLGSLQEGGGMIVEVRVREGSPSAGKRVRDIAWPAHCVVTAIQHMYSVRLATADEMIQAGDRVLVVTRPENIPELKELLHR